MSYSYLFKYIIIGDTGKIHCYLATHASINFISKENIFDSRENEVKMILLLLFVTLVVACLLCVTKVPPPVYLLVTCLSFFVCGN